MRCRTACLLALACLAVAPAAAASGGRYTLEGGTPAERGQVRAALRASSFDWDVVPGTVAIHVRRGIVSHASPGEIWLDASLLDAGSFAWAVVQHEYAHQVDYLLLTDADRARLEALLGGSGWCTGAEGLAHDDNACERFATSIAWAYWPAPANAFAPAPGADDSWLQPGPLRLMLAGMLGVRDPYPDRLTLSARPR